MAKHLEAPRIGSVSRREFLALTGVAALAVGAGEPVGKTAVETPGAEHVDLPRAPSHNPGFAGKELPEGGLLLWATGPDKRVKAYRLNAAGRTVWGLCDGARTPNDVAAAYAKDTGRSVDEARAFLKELAKRGVIATGGTVVASGDFPIPGKGGVYHMRVGDHQPPDAPE